MIQLILFAGVQACLIFIYVHCISFTIIITHVESEYTNYLSSTDPFTCLGGEDDGTFPVSLVGPDLITPKECLTFIP